MHCAYCTFIHFLYESMYSMINVKKQKSLSCGHELNTYTKEDINLCGCHPLNEHRVFYLQFNLELENRLSLPSKTTTHFHLMGKLFISDPTQIPHGIYPIVQFRPRSLSHTYPAHHTHFSVREIKFAIQSIYFLFYIAQRQSTVINYSKNVWNLL